MADKDKEKEFGVNSRILVMFCRSCVLTICLLVTLGATLAAEEYVIGPGDVLQVDYWQEPDLSQQVTVRQNGKISLSVIGEVEAAGLTLKRLEQFLVERISRVNRKISQVVVTVVDFRSRSVFVGGQVFHPGMQYFEVIPNLWETIKLAGGPTEIADLSNVAVLRSAEAGGEVINVDLAEILATGNLDSLPVLHPGYTVTVGRLPEGLTSEQFSKPNQRKKAFYIYGNVFSPGRHQMDAQIDLLEALVLAGGPGPQADLSRIRVISKGTNSPTVRIIDLEEYSNTGGPQRYLLAREDAVFVPTKRQGIFSGTWSAVRDLLAVAGTVSSFVLILSR